MSFVYFVTDPFAAWQFAYSIMFNLVSRIDTFPNQGQYHCVPLPFRLHWTTTLPTHISTPSCLEPRATEWLKSPSGRKDLKS